MKKDEVMQLLEQKGDADFVVRTAEEEKTFLDNYGKEIEERIIPSKIGEVHRQYDDDIYNILGKRKQPTEKTYEFLKRELSGVLEKARSADAILRDKKDLEEQIKNGTADKKVLADLEKVRAEYESLKSESESRLKNVQADFERFKIKSEIQGAISGLTFNDKIPQAALQALINSTVDDLAGKAEFRDGALYFLDKDGSPLRNRNNALEPYTAKELLSERLKEVLKPKGKDSGPVLKDDINKEYDKGGKLTKIAVVVPDSIKTKGELGDFLVSKGLLRGTPEYYLAYKEYSQGLPMR